MNLHPTRTKELFEGLDEVISDLYGLEEIEAGVACPDERRLIDEIERVFGEHGFEITRRAR